MTSWLHEQRLEAVLRVILDSDARTVLDLGCGDGDLVMRLIHQPQIARIVGIDLDGGALDRLRLRLEDLPGARRADVTLIQASMSEARADTRGFDCAVLLEAIEHIAPERLSVVERPVFSQMRPGRVVMTTPNAEFNALLGVPAGRFRHPDHRFEWGRAKFAQWAEGVARRHGYSVTCVDVAGSHPRLGGASQMAVFVRGLEG